MLEDLLQPSHLLVILAVALIFFGPRKLPELGAGIGEGIRNFKNSFKEVTSDVPARHED
ncbi:MAG TPA: twin-arginine translocase TatA/TatE family subunit [Bryobacteraceae bacterium]|nr:twin-arginine translocase TatA/TatE family subunit [Bryobacteraceae bacterium]